MCEMVIWFKNDYFSLDFLDGRKVLIPYSKVTSLEFDHCFPVKDHLYVLAIVHTANQKYSFMFRGNIDSLDSNGKDQSIALKDNMLTLELNILDRIGVDREYKLILDTTHMGEILCH